MLVFEDEMLDYMRFPHDWSVDPFLPGFGVVHFEFPKACYMPCIGVKTPNGLVFPRTSAGTSGVYATMCEVMMALKLGARVKALRFVVPYHEDGRPGALRDVYHDLILLRTWQQSHFGKKSVQQGATKLVNNSGYGKVAQDLSPKVRRDLWTLEVEDMSPSKVTSSVHAAASTALVRCILVAAINELCGLGYHLYSATTDGFISDASKDVLDRLPLMGLRKRLEATRSYLTDSATSEIFELKHTNEGFLNFTTRGNVAPNAGDSPTTNGVFARNGYKGYRSDSEKDRAEFIERIVTRDAPLLFHAREWTNPADMIRNDEDFHTYEVERHSNPNFDLKRKPDLDTLRDVGFIVGDTELTTPRFDTKPYETLAEFEQYKSWVEFFNLTRVCDYERLNERARAGRYRPRAYTRRDLVRFAVTAHRHRRVTIPALESLRGKARIDFINCFIDNGCEFTENDWKNAGRQERASSLPDPFVYQCVVDEMSATKERKCA